MFGDDEDPADIAAAPPVRTAKVLFPVNVAGAFDYAVPEGLEPRRGELVFAPLGRQVKLGVVMGLGERSAEGLKELLEIKATPALPGRTLDFVEWTARYGVASPGMVLRQVLRSWKALDPSPEVTQFRPSGQTPSRMNPAREAILASSPWPARASEIADRAGVSPGVVRGLAKAGGLVGETLPVDRPFDPPDPHHGGLPLTPAQDAAAAELRALVAREGFGVALLDGVTGSGKTEVYFEAVARALEAGNQVLVLVPEIALTQAGLRRITARFGAAPASWHSTLTDAERRRTWREVARGRARLVIGARSALFLPFPDLGLIVVDEEHDTSYKQEEGVIYNARDMAVVRAKIEGATCILASATPSLESLHNARSGRYHHVELPERPGSVVLPDIELVDLKDHAPARGDFLSAPLVEATRATLARGEQAMLFLNRRGYAPLIICRACGEKLKSPDTDSWLVEHRRTGRAICHHTGFTMPMPKRCPSCGEPGSLTSVGPGVERVAEEAARHFPDARIEVFSSDTTTTPAQLSERLARMEAGGIDILVGTQMVVKGHNFPRLTFVGVVDGDMALSGGDPRAGERTYQTLVQVAGRAGRADLPGTALIQTHQPEHEALQALADGDRETFVGVEMALREMLELPPFGRLAAVIVSGPEEARTDALAKAFAAKAPKTEGVTILGPSEPPLARLRGLYRRRLLVTAGPKTNLSAYMSTWRADFRLPSKYKLHIDIDPQSFM